MTDSRTTPEARHRTIQSYVVRAGRMTSAQQRAWDELWPRYGVDFSATRLDPDALFGRSAPRWLEIGFGNGDHLAALAQANPGIDFIGVEVHPPGVGHLLLAAATAGITNLRVVSHDAVQVLDQQIAPASLDRIVVLFPDPWPKKRHHKRRLVNATFADLCATRLRSGGVLQLATDWAPYAQWMLDVLAAHPVYRNLSADGPWMPRDPDRSPTRFERRGERLGHAVYDLAFARRDAERP